MAGVTVNDDRLLVMDFQHQLRHGVRLLSLRKVATSPWTTWARASSAQRGPPATSADDYGEEHVVAYDDGHRCSGS